MRTLLLAVVILGCGGAETLGSTSQAVLPPTGGPTKTGSWECYCSTNGSFSGTPVCVGSAWTCAPDDSLLDGWEAQCNGGTGSEFFDWDQTGQACTGYVYSGFPGDCPELTNVQEDGKYFCGQ